MFYKPTARFFQKNFSEKNFFFGKIPIFWSFLTIFLKKKFFFGKIFSKKSRVWFIKHPGAEAESKIEKKKNFWKNPKNPKNLTEKVVNFIYFEMRPRFAFLNLEKWVPWGPRNSNLPSEPHRHAKNGTSLCYHTCTYSSPILSPEKYFLAGRRPVTKSKK